MQCGTVLQFDILPSQHPHTCWSLCPSQGVATSPLTSQALQERRHRHIFIFTFTPSLPPFPSNTEALQHHFLWRKEGLTTSEFKVMLDIWGRLRELTKQQLFYEFILFKTKKDIIHTGTSRLKHTSPGGIKVDLGAFILL